MRALFSIAGVVRRYSGQGRKLGYPTANIEIEPDTPEGLFVGYTFINSAELPSIIFIGVPETVGDAGKRAESYILDFPDKDLYGQKIRIEIIKKLRDNKKFASVDVLLKQMKRDEITARQFFSANQDIND